MSCTPVSRYDSSRVRSHHGVSNLRSYSNQTAEQLALQEQKELINLHCDTISHSSSFTNHEEVEIIHYNECYSQRSGKLAIGGHEYARGYARLEEPHGIRSNRGSKHRDIRLENKTTLNEHNCGEYSH